jgi:hypothetical protein
MSFNQFTNLDFSDLRIQIKDYLRTNSKFTDFDFDGSNFSVLIDLLAYNSYITSYNTNMAVNEVFMDSATLRENVVSLARNIGYVPKSKRAAQSKISFTVNMSATDARTVKLLAGQVALGAVFNGNYIFSIPDDVIVPVNREGIAEFEELNIYEGVYLTNTFIVDTSQPNQRFIIPNVNVDTTTIRVTVTDAVDEVYTAFTNVLNVDRNSRIFLIQEIADEKYEIRFGDDIVGKKPTNGSRITVSYIITNGTLGNGASNFTLSALFRDNNGLDVTTGISAPITITKSADGDNIESVDSIKFIAPKIYASQFRAVTSNDYKALIPSIYANVDSVSTYGGEELNPPEYGKVFISIKPKNGTFLSEVTKRDILRSLRQYSIAGIKPEIVDLSYLYIEVYSTVYYNLNFTTGPEIVRSKVLNTLTVYGNSKDINNFGGRFKYSKVNALIDSTDKSITSNITKVLMRRDLNPEINNFATYELCFGNAIYVRDKGYSIKSTGFTIDGLEGTIYMADIPISTISGRIFFFRLERNEPVLVKNNAGTVNYVTGDLLLDVVKISGTSLSSGFIQVQAIPQSNDIVGLRDLYLQVDIQNSVVNTIEDIISSGENASATEFVSTSSYLNGKYTR